MAKVSQHVGINAGLSRSVNLERDQSTAALLDSYILTSCALQNVGHVVDVCRSAKDRDKAWSLIGAYGSGKSSFSLYLSHLLGNPRQANTKQALKKLESANADHASAIKNHLRGSPGYCRVLLTGYPESLARAFLQTLKNSIGSYYADLGMDRRGEVREINRLLRQDSIDLSAVAGLIKKVQKKIQNAKGKGLLIVIDELGKFLEYAARHESDDIFLLQVLAEQAHQTGQSNILLFVLLHQSFEQYGRNLGSKLKNEWTKIQGRYQTVPFVETTEQSLHIMAQVFQNRLPKSWTARINKQIKDFVADMSKAKVLPQGLNQKESLALFRQCYPLHPMTLLLLPVLCRKIAQNERSLFNYLGSSEDGGLVGQMKHTEVGKFVYPNAVYDYFINAQPLTNDFQVQRAWFEVTTALDRLSDGSPAETSLLKTIGLFNIAGSIGALKASKPVIRLCFESPHGLNAALKGLTDQSFITFRKFNHEYRVWQGSDFDLQQALSEQEPSTRTMDLASELNALEVFQPFVARRYSIEKHSLFYFQPKFINVTDYEKEPKDADKPRIVFCLSNGNGRRDEKLFKEEIVKYFGKQDLVVFCANSKTIKKVCRTRVALQQVGRTPEVNQDPVIQREFKLHFAAAQQQEREEVMKLVEQPADHLWYCAGKRKKINAKRDIQETLSERLEEVYPHTPIIQNELINRDHPSGQANYGRRMLMLALLQNKDKEDLGIEAYPAEKSMYLAILKSSKVHNQRKGQWQIVSPTRDDPCRFRKVWNEVAKFFDSTREQAKDFSELDAILTAPPYGVKKAMLPVFYMMVYLSRQDEIAVYEDRMYAPYFTAEHMERFLKRPSSFSFQQFKIAGLTQALMREYEQGLFEGNKSKNALALFRPMAKFISDIPLYTKQTETISKTAQKVRDVFKHPKSPQDLLFEKLPAACGYKGKRVNGFGGALKKALREINNAYPNMMDRQTEKMKKIFNLPNGNGLEKLRLRARETCEQLRGYTLDETMHVFIDGIMAEFGNDERWLERISALVAGKPPKDWSDSDSLYAQHKIMEYGLRLNELEKLKVYAIEHALKDSQGEAVLISIKSSKTPEPKDRIIQITNDMSMEEKKDRMQEAYDNLAERFLLGGIAAKSDRVRKHLKVVANKK